MFSLHSIVESLRHVEITHAVTPMNAETSLVSHGPYAEPKMVIMEPVSVGTLRIKTWVISGWLYEKTPIAVPTRPKIVHVAEVTSVVAGTAHRMLESDVQSSAMHPVRPILVDKE